MRILSRLWSINLELPPALLKLQVGSTASPVCFLCVCVDMYVCLCVFEWGTSTTCLPCLGVRCSAHVLAPVTPAGAEKFTKFYFTFEKEDPEEARQRRKDEHEERALQEK